MATYLAVLDIADVLHDDLGKVDQSQCQVDVERGFFRVIGGNF